MRDIDCETAMRQMFEFLDSEMPEVDADVIRHHLNACGQCLDEFDYQMAVKALVQRSCREQAPAELRSRVVAQLHISITVADLSQQTRPPSP